jgi:hypothetical protein
VQQPFPLIKIPSLPEGSRGQQKSAKFIRGNKTFENGTNYTTKAVRSPLSSVNKTDSRRVRAAATSWKITMTPATKPATPPKTWPMDALSSQSKQPVLNMF